MPPPSERRILAAPGIEDGRAPSPLRAHGRGITSKQRAGTRMKHMRLVWVLLCWLSWPTAELAAQDRMEGLRGEPEAIADAEAMVEAMGGTIGFDSKPDVETTFWVEFSQ